MNKLNIPLLCKDRKGFPELSPFASWPGAITDPQWFELPISRTNFHGPKDVWVIEIRLYNGHYILQTNEKQSNQFPLLQRGDHNTDNPIYTDTRYEYKIRYNDNLTVTKPSFKGNN